LPRGAISPLGYGYQFLSPDWQTADWRYIEEMILTDIMHGIAIIFLYSADELATAVKKWPAEVNRRKQTVCRALAVET